MPELRIQTEESESSVLPADLRDGSRPLTAWLARHGHPLNTRCGEKGICNGCRVYVGTEEETRRACSLTLREVLPFSAVRIPPESRMQKQTTALSEFRIHLPFASAWTQPGSGLAIDIGTTTVAGALVDLPSATVQAVNAVGNAQVSYGDNVLSRIQHCIYASEFVPKMHRALIDETLNQLVENLCREAGIDPTEIRLTTISGNPTMLHLLMAENPACLGHYPFKPVFLDAKRIDDPSRLALAWSGPIQLLPAIGPFVGADLTAGLLSSGMLYHPETCLLVDIGTNGEIVLKHGDELYGTATAAGPAFEGGRLLAGSYAAPGTVSGIRLDAASHSCILETIADPAGKRNALPQGICGSAYIDFLAEAVQQKLISPVGRFQPDADWPQLEVHPEEGKRFLLQPGRAPRLRINEADIAELLQAKSAIGAGILTVLDEHKLQPADIHTLFLAGGFGRFLDVDHAIAIGLLPGFQRKQIEVIGNSSLAGAFLALIDPELLQEMNEAVRRSRNIELNQLPQFEDRFLDCLTLGPQPD